MARNKFDIDETLDSEFNKEHFKRVLKYAGKYKKTIFTTTALMLVSSVLGLLGPIFYQVVIDDMIPDGNIAGIVIMGMAYLISLIACGVILKFKIRQMAKVGQGVVHDIRSDLFRHLQKLPFSYYDSRPHGKILVRVVNYINALSDLLSNGIINIITDLFSLFAIIFFMFYIDSKLTLVCLAGLLVFIVVVMFIKNKHRKAWQIQSAKQSNLNAYIHESIAGMKVTQSFAREDENYNIFMNQCDDNKNTWLKAKRIELSIWPIVDFLSVITVSAVYILGIQRYISDTIRVGELIAFVSYIWRFWNPIIQLGNYYNQIVTCTAYLERIFEAMDEPTIVNDLPGATNMPRIKGEVEFENVNFYYEDGVRILNNVSFRVKMGQSVALVGPTGSGKTTITSIISRFYDIESGKVLIDGIDIKHVTLYSLRSQMGIMLQDSFIFSGSIKDNIRYGRLNATDDEIIEAAKTVCAHDFIENMPEGYNTYVNERGTRLSVGQRQLISFARALLADPAILVLDEATSSIDTETEIALQKGLDRLLKGRTSFVIAHRLSTIKNCDKIMYIDGGTIKETGDHEQLMKRKGPYYQLYNAQYKLLEI